MINHLARADTYVRLGLVNVAKVAAYKLGLKCGLHPVQRITASVAQPPFFHPTEAEYKNAEPNRSWTDRLWYFGKHNVAFDSSPPDWFSNPFSASVQPDAKLDWWHIPDFGNGDIKGLWELSRMEWVVAWATTAAFGEASALERLNIWLADWANCNPPFKGPNWKCGQEASIRVMHLVVAAWVLGQDKTPEAGLIDLLRAHLERISPATSYAIGQQNNHGTSEAAALFIGGSFMEGHDARADTWVRRGRSLLENLAATLIETDGSFSQYSVTYHRMMLDTYALLEAWRRHRRLPAFSERLRGRLAAATNWLWTVTDAQSGDAPNIGANDGARLLQLVGSDYRDFRPSIQLAAALFLDADAFGPGIWETPLRWLGVESGKPFKAPASQSFNKGGFHVMKMASTMVVLRYPQFRFRPSQADALHLDFWHNGINLLRDAGTFSYNSDGSEWFAGTGAHNTVQFDRRDQMPRLGRFLFGNWLESECVKPVFDDGTMASATAAYTDYRGARHERDVTLSADALICKDTISGSFKEACLRWRCAPGDWFVENDLVCDGRYSIAIEVDGEAVTPSLGTSMESRYYQNKSQIPEVLVKVTRPATIITTVTF